MFSYVDLQFLWSYSNLKLIWSTLFVIFIETHTRATKHTHHITLHACTHTWILRLFFHARPFHIACTQTLFITERCGLWGKHTLYVYFVHKKSDIWVNSRTFRLSFFSIYVQTCRSKKSPASKQQHLLRYQQETLSQR